jgi:4-amino-4-deoxy-L-arabinose transferase-like glycosyltransferase
VPRPVYGLVVFLASLGLLLWKAGDAAIATAWIDPVANVQAQDEAVYAYSSWHMLDSGDWLTPRFLGRYALYKPPALYWASAASAAVLGRSALALRVPVAIAGALAVALIFAWVAGESGAWAGLAAALLLLGNHLFFVLSRTAVTDALLAVWIVVAMFALWRDPRLESRFALGTFGAACGLAIMTKAVAGVLPVLIWMAAAVLLRPRPDLKRMAQAVGLMAAVALPWHVWQLAVHPRWFWAEYVVWEHFTQALGSPVQTTAEPRLTFYLSRLLLLDPVLLAAAAAAVIALAGRGVRPLRLPMLWAGLVLLAVLAFRYRNASYLLPMWPAMAILAGVAIPRRWGPVAFGAALGLLAVKAGFPAASWGLPFAPESRNPSYPALERYAALDRPRELIVAAPDDQFYASLLDLPRVRYAYLDPNGPGAAGIDFHHLGITVTVPEFAHLHQRLPVYRERLREMDLDTTEPVATVIVARSEDEMRALIAGHPQADFFVPPAWAGFGARTHTAWRAAGERVFLLAR